MWQRNTLGFATPEEATEWALQHPFTLDAIIELQHLPQKDASENSGAEGEPLRLPVSCSGGVYMCKYPRCAPWTLGRGLASLQASSI